MTGGGETTGSAATDRDQARIERWLDALDARHLERLTFAEVRRGLQALSAIYVERRGRLPAGEALSGAGKRAAFALFYGPLHFMLVRAIVRSIGAASPAPRVILDLGCGTGAAGAAWVLETGGASHLAGVDRSGWAIEEARWEWHALGLHGTAARGDVARAALPSGRGGAILAAFLVNELPPETRDDLRDRFLSAARRGAAVLVIEPVARRALAWWDDWAAAFTAAGGRADTWRFPADLPERIRLLDRAAHLDHRELTGRSLYIAGR